MVRTGSLASFGMPDLPTLDGYRFRGPDLTSDIRSMAELLNTCNDADGTEFHTSEDDIAVNYRHLETSEPSTDMLMAEKGASLVGYTRAEWWQELDGPRVHASFAFVHPDARADGLTDALLNWSETRNREVARQDRTTNAVYEGWVVERRQDWLAAVYEDRGYQVITFAASMERSDLLDIPEVDLPAGVETRPVEPRHLRAIWVADAEAFRDHWGYSEPTETQYQRFLDFPHRDESLWKIAWHGDRIVGQVRSFINTEENAKFDRTRGYTEFISTARDWRKRGIATALICASLTELADRGMTEAALNVHTENPNGAYDLYKSLGFEVVESFRTYRKPFDPSG